MKVSKIGILAMACLAIAIASTGCVRKPGGRITQLHGQKAVPPPEPPPVDTTKTTAPTKEPEIGPGNVATTDTKGPGSTDLKTDGAGTETADPSKIFEGKFIMDETIFAGNTVYFEFDRSELKSSERTKADEVGVFLKGKAEVSVLVDGHCDERGTEEYNRSLGERRALSIREYLINSGISADRIHTRSWGEDKPTVPGQNDAAWAKNRRGAFILLKPKQ